MIVAYYPGGGGHRYLQFINKKEFRIPGIVYDGVSNLKTRALYFDTDTPIENNYIDLPVHCVNYNRIRDITQRTDITLIRSDLQSSLCREWSIKGKYRPMFFPEQINYDQFLLELYVAIKDPSWPNITTVEQYKQLPKEIYNEVELNFEKNKQTLKTQSQQNFLISAYTAIAWHSKLYQRFPFDPGPGTLIDIDTDTTEFGQVMRRELESYKHNKLFNFAWEVYMTLGENAPIITLFEESKISNE